MEKSAEFYSLEKGILSLKEQIDALNETEDLDKKDKIASLRLDIDKEWARILPKLTTVNIVQIARHPKRPYTLDYIAFLFQDFMEMHGDRRFADDPAIVAGLAFYKGRTVAVIGHQKGRTTRARIDRNFGQANPEGYRKALRVMQEAEKFGFPVITFVDNGGVGSHGGGAFSGKDPSRMDRSASYMARHVAKNIVAAALAGKCEVQIAYSIGKAEPVSLMIDTSRTSKIPPDQIAKLVQEHFDLRPRALIKYLDL